MPKTSILVVDDEEDILELLKFNLEREGFKVICSETGEKALQAVRNSPPDLVLLDLMLPGINGLEVARALKSNPNTSSIPVIMLTAKGDESDVVRGLEIGADDYVTKPFSPRVIVARVRAVMRRQTAEPDDGFQAREIHGITIHPGRREVAVNGKEVKLTMSEFDILHYLAQRPGWVFTRSQIVSAVRGEGFAVTDRSVDVQIVGLRKKLGTAGKFIETVRGVGYRLKE
ncbi:MAG: response regulator transcription factor [Desulfatibacillum sp.]|nr:response regulator transcription factor [Desulfatibacillum sp.]